jgi:hypothetical protein
MSWQLWVLVATAAAAMVGLFVLKVRNAQEVFERIVGPGDAVPDTVSDGTTDEVARRRLAHSSAKSRMFQHHPHVAGHRRQT